MLLLIFSMSCTEIISTSYELKYSEMLMININHLLELFPILVKYYPHKNLKISIKSSPSLTKP